MSLPRKLRIRNRAVILVLLPVTFLLWLIGWAFYWTGSQNRSSTPKTKTETYTPIATAIPLEDYDEAKA